REGDGLLREEERAVRADELGRGHRGEGRLRRGRVRIEPEGAARIPPEQHRVRCREHRHRRQPRRGRQERQQLRVLGIARPRDRRNRRKDSDSGRGLDDLDAARTVQLSPKRESGGGFKWRRPHGRPIPMWAPTPTVPSSPYSPAPRKLGFLERLRIGWQLTKVSLGVLRKEKGLILLPFLSLLITGAVWILFFITIFFLTAPSDVFGFWLFYVGLAIVYFV